MATVAVQRIALPPGAENHNAQAFKWVGMANGDVGEAVELGAYSDVSVHVKGTFGAAGSAQQRGSNLEAPDVTTATDWATHADPQGNALDITSAKIETILEATRWFSPKITAGDGTTAIEIYLYAIKRK